MRALVAPFKASAPKLSDDYFKVLIYYSAAIHPEDNFTFRKVLHYQGVAPTKVVTMIQTAMSCKCALSGVPEADIATSCGIAAQVCKIIDSADTILAKVAALALAIEVNDAKALQSDIEKRPIGQAAQVAANAMDDEAAELEELGIQQASAVDLMTIVGSKGLSADHVIVLGVDDVNMTYVTENAFYVAMTRARKSLHLLAALGAGGSKQIHFFALSLPDDDVTYSSYVKTGAKLTDFAGRDELLAHIRKMQYAKSQASKRRHGRPK